MTDASRAPSTTGDVTYDVQPTIPLPESVRILRGRELWQRIGGEATARASGSAPLVLVDAYPGADLAALIAEAGATLPGWRVVSGEDAARQNAEIDELIAPNPTDDHVFGGMDDARTTAIAQEESLAARAAGITIAGEPEPGVGGGG